MKAEENHSYSSTLVCFVSAGLLTITYTLKVEKNGEKEKKNGEGKKTTLSICLVFFFYFPF
jgi:hypothetical protein